MGLTPIHDIPACICAALHVNTRFGSHHQPLAATGDGLRLSTNGKHRHGNIGTMQIKECN